MLRKKGGDEYYLASELSNSDAHMALDTPRTLTIGSTGTPWPIRNRGFFDTFNINKAG
jgi:hypothetical protein